MTYHKPEIVFQASGLRIIGSSPKDLIPYEDPIDIYSITVHPATILTSSLIHHEARPMQYAVSPPRFIQRQFRGCSCGTASANTTRKGNRKSALQ